MLSNLSYDELVDLDLSKTCNICGITKSITEFYKHPTGTYKVRPMCKLCSSTKCKEYYGENREDVLKVRHIYLDNPDNREKHNRCVKRYFNNKMKDDPYDRLVRRLRSRIRYALKAQDADKIEDSLTLLGCDVEFFKEHLQQTAIDNGFTDFDINDYSGEEYHIDHIIPCASFDLTDPEQQKRCFNWRNQQILRAEDNLAKGAKIEKD